MLLVPNTDANVKSQTVKSEMGDLPVPVVSLTLLVAKIKENFDFTILQCEQTTISAIK